MNVRSGDQMPVRSGLPSAALGGGPEGLAFSFSADSSAVPPPAGSVAASCAKANGRQRQNNTAAFLMWEFYIYSPRAACSSKRAARAGLNTPQEQNRVR